jgi:hypothetical protein
MPRRFQFSLGALLLLAFAAAVWTLIAVQIRDACTPGLGPADWRYLNRAKAAAAREQVEHD